MYEIVFAFLLMMHGVSPDVWPAPQHLIDNGPVRHQVTDPKHPHFGPPGPPSGVFIPRPPAFDSRSSRGARP